MEVSDGLQLAGSGSCSSAEERQLPARTGYSPAGRHMGPTIRMSTNTIKTVFTELPEVIDPRLSSTNQEQALTSRDLRTPSGVSLYTQMDSHHRVTPQPRRKPTVSAYKNHISCGSKEGNPSTGQARISSPNLAGSLNSGIVPKKSIRIRTQQD